MWPNEKTAFVVIHGVGQQSPFDPLDAFVRTFHSVLTKANPDSQIDLHHRITTRRGSSGQSWTESYISFVNVDKPEITLDIYEYYWAHQTQRQITLGEVGDWIVKAFERDIRLKTVGLFFKAFSFLDISSFSPYTRIPVNLISTLVGKTIVNYLGDLAIYTSTDIKSKHFEVRQNILAGVVEKVRALLVDDSYPQLIMAGHSLGSVICYDALNRINLESNVPNGRFPAALLLGITGLVTFGSPLDKVHHFFRQRAKSDQSVKAQILANLHGFKLRPDPMPALSPTVETTIQPYLNHVKWLNYWNPKDPISDSLERYDVPTDDSKRVDIPGTWFGAHVRYWDHEPMYLNIAENLFV